MKIQFFRFPAITTRRLQIFVSDFSATGVARNAIAIANHAARDGYQVRILSCVGTGVLRGEVDPAVEIIELLPPSAANASRRSQLQSAFRAYRKHSQSWRPDIYFSAGNHGHLLSSLASLGLPGTKLLRISNDLDHRGVKRSIRQRLQRAAKFRILAALADRLVLVSRSHRDHPLLAELLRNGKAVVIPNGVDVDMVRRGAGRGPSHPWLADRSVPTVLAVGRHVPEKNFDALLRAFAHARRQEPMRLLFLGDGKAQAVARLKALAADLGVAESVAFVASVSNPFPFMAAAKALVLPSLWEGSSNVLLEAMACGTPVIAARTAGDAVAVLGKGRYGLLIDPFDERQLSQALLRQAGPDAVGPGDRANDFAREEALEKYLCLFDEETASRSARSVEGTFRTIAPA